MARVEAKDQAAAALKDRVAVSPDSTHVSQIVLPTTSFVYTQVTSENSIVHLNYQLINPDTGKYACPSQVCYVGEQSSFGSVAAGTDLVFELYGYAFGQLAIQGSSESSYADIFQDTPTEWTIDFENGTINVYALSEPPLSTLGSPPTGTGKDPQCLTQWPVNCATGNFTHTFTDLSVPGDGVSLDLTRTYNSLAASTEGMFGYGWSSSYAMSLSFDSAGDATLTGPEGAQTLFYSQGGGAFAVPPNVLASLVQDSDGTYTLTEPGQKTFTFSSTGQLTAERDPNGYATTLAYNASGQLTTVTDPGGRMLTFAYGSNGLVSSVTDSAGREVSYGYDASGNLTSVTDAAGGVWSFGYDGSHLLTSMTDPRNDGSLTNTYDSSGRVTEQLDWMGRKTTFSYGTPDGTGVQTNTVTSPNGNVTSETYTDGTLSSLTKASGTSGAATWTYAYDQQFDVTSITDPDSHVWTATYDVNGNQTSATDPLGHTTSASYNGFDEPTAQTDANGITTSYSYDADGNLTSVSRPLTSTGQTQTTSYAYTDSANPGRPTSITDPDGNKTTLAYDSYGDLISRTDPSGDETTYSYSCTGGPSAGCYPNIGLVYATVSPRGNATGADPAQYTTSYTYDALGNPTSITDPLGNKTTYAYDADSNRTSVTTPGNQTTGYEYDADNELVKIDRADQTSLQNGYDGDGNLTSQTDGAGNQTTYAYDPLDRLISVTDPLKRTTSYTYDGAGNQITKTDPAGRTTTYGYDNANRLTSLSYSDGTTPKVSYGCDAAGLRTSMSDGTGSSSYSYDSLDRLTSQTNGAGQTVSYGYDLADNTTSITYPNGKAVSRTFDPSERLSSVTDWLGNKTTFAYDPDSDPQTTTFPAATTDVDSYSYDNADQLTGIQAKQGSTTLAQLTYTRDPDGMVASETQTGPPGPASTSYAYTPLQQLQSAGSQSYAYDHADNITQLDSQTGYSYDAANQLTSGPAGTYSYDQLGQRTSLTQNSQSTSYAYDQAGDLTKTTPPTGSATSYTYDGDGIRASKTTGTTTSQYAYDQTAGIPLILTDGQNSYIYGPNNLPIEQIDSSGTPSWLHHDQLGSTRLITNQTGAVTGAITYNPYGAVAATSGTATTPLGYAGQYTDPETGLQYDRARYYDPNTGQFLTRDPLTHLTRQPYIYANDNPLAFSDPSGELFGLDSELGGVVGGVVGGVAGGASYLYGTATGQQQFSWSGLGAATASGAAGGAVAGACVGTTWVDVAGCGALGGAAASVVSTTLNGQPPSVSGVLWGAATGAAGGVAGRAMFPLRGFRPYKLSNVWNPGPNTIRLYGQATTSGIIGLARSLFGSSAAYGKSLC